MASETGFAVGERVVEAGGTGALATVRYVGDVAGTEGAWVGVEWDDVGRGKHDGTHAGVRYFKCVAGAGCARAASFVRPKKLSKGMPYADAVRCKYLAQPAEEEVAAAGEREMYVETAGGSKVQVEVVGADIAVRALRQLDLAERVFLPDACVAGAGEPGEVAAVTPNVTYLDLQGNPLPTWRETTRFLDELPALRVLNLSRVRGCWPEAPPEPAPRYERLRDLVLNGAGIRWEQVELIAPQLPGLEELHLCENALEALTPAGGAAPLAELFPSLLVLNLEGNALADWAEVERVAPLASLQRLHLGGNALARLAYPALPGGAPAFACLRSLLLADNKLDSWESVDALNEFPSLMETRLSGNPVTDAAQGIFGGTRHEVVARVGRLTSLNGSAVGAAERRDAEIRYLRRVLGEQAACSEDDGRKADVAARNPRLTALVDAHGALSVNAAAAGGAGGDGMLSLTLRYIAGEKPESVKKLPRSLTVGKLKLLCERLFKSKVAKQKLFLKVRGDPVPWPLDNDEHDLHYLGVVDGGIVLVDEEG